MLATCLIAAPVAAQPDIAQAVEAEFRRPNSMPRKKAARRFGRLIRRCSALMPKHR
ncbi:MAG: hypothetical protein IPF76_10540 [Sphingopyxis sp.]|jgi:hypothetical protein|nr:hypothetical protein [Sphingopyxis sp.]